MDCCPAYIWWPGFLCWRCLWITGWWFQNYFQKIHPYLGRFFPIWLAHIFQMGWFNHQLDYDYQVRPSNPPIIVSSILWISDYQSSSCKVGTSECYVAGRCLDRRWSGFPLWKRRGTYCWCFRNPANSLYVKYPIVYRVLYIPNGAGFLPSTLFPGEYEGTLMWHCHLRIDNDV